MNQTKNIMKTLSSFIILHHPQILLIFGNKQDFQTFKISFSIKIHNKMRINENNKISNLTKMASN